MSFVRRVTRLSIMLAACTMILALLAPVAGAQTPVDAEVSFETSVRDFQPTAGYQPLGGVAGASTQSTSPSGCVQAAHNPHESHHVPGTINAEVRATCNNAVPYMYHTAQLWETRWWGWDRIGQKGTFSKAWRSQGSAYANDQCRNNWIRVTGSGYVDDVDGNRYYANTESNHVHNPCNL